MGSENGGAFQVSFVETYRPNPKSKIQNLKCKKEAISDGLLRLEPVSVKNYGFRLPLNVYQFQSISPRAGFTNGIRMVMSCIGFHSRLFGA